MDYIWMLRSIFMLAGVVLTVGVVWFFFKYRKFKKTKWSVDRSKWKLMSFHKLGFSEDEILDALDEDNVIGSGSSGKVYKVVLSNGETVAVKKLWGCSKLADESSDIEKANFPEDGFDAEVDTLGKIRHKNIVKLWCCCSTRGCKLLVYEYMPNGSLGDLLRSTKSGLLDWPIRFKIAMDAAEGLSYLHHDFAPPIVHRDVKSNNILLDADYGARVADFGVAKVVDVSGKGIKSMSVIAGSRGYIAPAKENFELALEADNSNTHSRYWLSKLHMKYHVPGACKAVGAALLVEAAEMGDPDAQYELGCSLRVENDYVQSDQRAFYYLEKAVDQLHPGALYLLGAVYLTGDCVKKDYASAMWCFHRASEKGHAGAAVAYGSLLLRGVQVPESLTKFNAKRGSSNRKSRKNSGSLEPNPVEMAKEQFEIAANAGCDLGFRWLKRLEEEEKRLLVSQS